MFLAHEQYCGSWVAVTNLPRDFDPILHGKPDIEQDQIWLQFLRFPNRFDPIRDLADDLQFRLLLKYGNYKATKRFIVFYYENSDCRDTQGLLLRTERAELTQIMQIKANFLMSPPLVVAFALAGRVDIDLSTESLGKDRDGNDVLLAPSWGSTVAER